MLLSSSSSSSSSYAIVSAFHQTADSALESVWQAFLSSERFISNDILFGVAIQQFLQTVYILSSIVMTALFLYHHFWSQKEVSMPSLRIGFILKWLALNSVVLILVAALPPYFGIRMALPAHAPSFSQFAYEFAVEMFWYDIMFFAVHYALHAIPWLYKNVHSVHHQCTPVVAVHSQVIHPLEMLLMTIPAILPGAVLQHHPLSFLSLQTTLVVYGAFVHAHFDVNIEKLTLGIFCGCISHGRHHTTCDTNYGGFTTFMDRLFGTYSFDKHRRNNTVVDFLSRNIDEHILGR
eukprot:ANDGO_07348.mRNA.1 Methylsterol monooxygenase 2-2